MNDLFSIPYEVWLQFQDSQYKLIFDTLFDEGGYIQMGLLFLLAPISLWALFYYVWTSPYGKLTHWLLWLVIVAVIVGTICGIISNNVIFNSDNQELINALADPESGYEDYAITLRFKYAIANGILSVFMSFIYSLILKQKSKLQIHLPF